MAECGACGKHLPEDPNEMEEIVECRYCDQIFCSDECAMDHQTQAHTDEAMPTDEEDEERRS